MVVPLFCWESIFIIPPSIEARSFIPNTPNVFPFSGLLFLIPFIEADFFEKMFNEFDLNPKLGIASGRLVQNFKVEYIRNDNVIRGATMIYRKKCFDQIKFNYTSRGEDEMNAYTARYYGWDTKTFDIYFLHLKHEGVRNTQLFNHYETGIFKGRIPYNFLFFFLTLINNIFNKPFIIGSFVQLFGYLKIRYFTVDKLFNQKVCRFIRKEQIKRLKNLYTDYNKHIARMNHTSEIESDIVNDSMFDIIINGDNTNLSTIINIIKSHE